MCEAQKKTREPVSRNDAPASPPARPPRRPLPAANFDLLTAQDRDDAETHADCRARVFTIAWQQARDGYLTGVAIERARGRT